MYVLENKMVDHILKTVHAFSNKESYKRFY